MAYVMVQLRVMPTGTDVDLEKLKAECKKKIEAFGIKAFHSVKDEPIAFGLKAIDFTFMMDEKQSNTDKLEADIRQVEGVNSAEILDVRRALG